MSTFPKSSRINTELIPMFCCRGLPCRPPPAVQVRALRQAHRVEHLRHPLPHGRHRRREARTAPQSLAVQSSSSGERRGARRTRLHSRAAYRTWARRAPVRPITIAARGASVRASARPLRSCPSIRRFSGPAVGRVWMGCFVRGRGAEEAAEAARAPSGGERAAARQTRRSP